MAADSEEEFAELAKALAQEIQGANVDYRMYRDLQKTCAENPVVVQQSCPFLPMTIDAHLNSAVLRLCRVYDTEKSSLNLRSWLGQIKANPDWFTEAAFQTRKSNPISEWPGTPDVTQLEADITYAGMSNPVVKNLILFRGNMFAHLGESWVLNRRDAKGSFKVTLDDIANLAEQGLTIVNRYLHYYDSQENGADLIRADGFQFIFRELSKVLKKL